jgi:uncharacterized alkaline shock family protein YloU
MDMTPDRLTCGSLVDDLLAQVAEGRDERTAHQEDCPHCQAALGEYRRLWSAVDRLATEPVRTPDTILSGVLAGIRAATEHPGYGVVVTPLGATRISDRVVAVTARIAAEQVNGVRVALGRVDGTNPSAGTFGSSTALQITVAATYGQDLHALADRIREVVGAHVRALTSLEPVEITVVVDEVLPPPAA